MGGPGESWGSGHPPTRVWVPTAKRTPGAVAVGLLGR